MVFSLCPRCDISLDPMEMSTPVEARHLLTSVAQVVQPALYLSMSRPGFTASICCLFSFLRCFTVSFSTSRQLLMRARLFLSIKGFITFLYWSVLDSGSSASGTSILIAGAMATIVGYARMVWVM